MLDGAIAFRPGPATNQPKTASIVARNWWIPIPHCRPKRAGPGISSAATKDSRNVFLDHSRALLGGYSLVGENVLAPFKNVAVHIEETEGIG
jgi:hypothetical protein